MQRLRRSPQPVGRVRLTELERSEDVPTAWRIVRSFGCAKRAQEGQWPERRPHAPPLRRRRHDQADAAEQARHLSRRDEELPPMRVKRQDPGHCESVRQSRRPRTLLSAEVRRQPRRPRSIDRVEHEERSRSHHPCDLASELRKVEQVLDHVARQHNVEGAVFERQLEHGATSSAWRWGHYAPRMVVNLQPL